MRVSGRRPERQHHPLTEIAPLRQRGPGRQKGTEHDEGLNPTNNEAGITPGGVPFGPRMAQGNIKIFTDTIRLLTPPNHDATPDALDGQKVNQTLYARISSSNPSCPTSSAMPSCCRSPKDWSQLPDQSA